MKLIQNFGKTLLSPILFILGFVLLSQPSNSQSVLLDDFNRANAFAIGTGWSETETVASSGVQLSTNMVQMGTTIAGREYMTYDVSTLYNTVIGTNSGLLTWEFNLHTNNSNASGVSGFDNSNYGLAFVLGCTTNNFLTGSGYAVVYGNTGSSDNIRLVRFANGVVTTGGAGLTNIISPATAFTTQWITVKVTYNPVGNAWSLYTASSTTAFIDPTVATYTLQGTGTDATYVGNDLLYLGFLYNHATSSTFIANFDNVRIPSACIVDVQPTIQPSALTFSAVGANSMTLSWTNGNGTGSLVLIHAGSAVTSTPTDGAVYSASSVYGSGTQLNAGDYIVYMGGASTVTVTGLSANTTYYFSIFEYNGTGCTANYLLPSPLTSSQLTPGCVLAAQPTTNATALSISSTMANSLGLTWIRGNGAYCIVVCRGGGPVTTVPTDGISYTANATYGLGSAIAPGDYVVYSGTGNSTTVLGLMPGTTYYFQVFEMNGTGCNTNYYVPGTPTSTNGVTTPVVAYTNYFGNLHSHSDYSDGDMDNVCNGAGSPTCCYAIGAGATNFNFMGISDHNHNEGPVMTPALFASGVSEAATYNAGNPAFAALYGTEWGTISTGGHVAFYGINQLVGWNTGNYNVYIAKGDYNSLFNLIASTTGAFATLCHPNSTDFNNILNTAYNATYDNAVVGCAVKNGPYNSTNTTYSDPAASSTVAYWNSLLGKGYHLGPTMDLDNHNSNTMGKTSQERTVVLAPSLSPANVMEAMLNMRFYATEDYNLNLTYNINGIFPLGSIVTQTINPTINVTATDGNSETISQIRIYYGVPGSNASPTVLTSAAAASLTYTHSFASGTYYYYAEITQADGQKAYTSPIWYTKIITPLPIELLSFDGTHTSKGNHLEWVTASEIDNSYFSLERSRDGIYFEEISKVAGAGTSSVRHDYEYLDMHAAEGLNYYRLRQTDFNGKYSYSSVIAIRSAKRGDIFTVFPNPSHGNFTIAMNDLYNEAYELKIFDAVGQLVYSQNGITESQMSITPELPEGIYTMSLVFEGGVFVERLVFGK